MRSQVVTAARSREAGASIVALLGPTNTGKTHAAVERMLEHASGVIGLPLRLLAREVYDRVSARIGEGAVALVTGEEKRVPPRPRYFVCTAEAMPEGKARAVDFVAVDEVQLAGHRERGHVFTDRLLHWRGRRETWFMGADTIRALVAELVPAARIETRPRLSALASAGNLAPGALPPRTAVVAFSAERVYALGERLRARRGGAAVVLGALSPRARNAQVALYQAGEVDYLVATDAIGMGLNMDVDCVAFADARKFDGREGRALDDAELAQIAGRAGRHHRPGAFATLDPLPPFGPATVRALETHRFPGQRQLFWRSRDLDLRSVEALLASLRQPPGHPGLRRAEDAADERALVRLGRDAELAPLLRGGGGAAVPLLWDVCQIPDFRQHGGEDHFGLLAAIFRQLAGPRGALDADWLDRRVARLDDSAGDLGALLDRLASIRTWTYVAHRADWVPDAAAWQERARAIEDRLSDALHDRLVARFVDPSGAGRRRQRGGRAGVADVAPPAPAQAVFAGGRSLGEQLRSLLGGGGAGGRRRDGRWVEALVTASHEHFRVGDDGRIADGAGVALGRLSRGADLLHPEVTLLLGDDELGAGARLRVHRRLLAFARDLAAELVETLRSDAATAAADASPEERSASPPAPPPPPAARGLLYQLEHGLGTVRVEGAVVELGLLDEPARAALGARGVRVGRHLVFAPALLRPEALRRRALLCAAYLRPDSAPAVPPPGAVSLPIDPDVPPEIYTALGFPLFGGRAIRADVVESVARRLAGRPSPRELLSRLRCAPEQLPAIRQALRAPGHDDEHDHGHDHEHGDEHSDGHERVRDGLG